MSDTLSWTTKVDDREFHVTRTWNPKRGALTSCHFVVCGKNDVKFEFDVGDESEYNGRRFNDVYKEEFQKALKKFGE